MGHIVFPHGESHQRTGGELPFFFGECQIFLMKPVEETRRQRLLMLIKQHDGQTSLIEKLPKEISASTVSRIANANVRHDRGGAVYVMGSPMAREIEHALSLPNGWMDTPLTYSELHGEDDPRTKAMQLMEALPPDQWATAVRLLDALAQPARANGTTGGPAPH